MQHFEKDLKNLILLVNQQILALICTSSFQQLALKIHLLAITLLLIIIIC